MASHCDTCNRTFSNITTLQQHISESAAHKSSLRCEACRQSFTTTENLIQHLRFEHLRDAPTTEDSFSCTNCKKPFKSANALISHLRNSNVHKPKEQSLLTKTVPKQTPATVNNPSNHACSKCPVSFYTLEALEMHAGNAHPKQRKGSLPLDKFFRSFPTFKYQSDISPALSYINLRRHKGWLRGSTESNQGWQTYQKALERELHIWFNIPDDFTNSLVTEYQAHWEQSNPRKSKNAQLFRMVRYTHISVVDLVEYGRSDRKNDIQTFQKWAGLQEHIRLTSKHFTKTFDGKNKTIVLAFLLRRAYQQYQRVYDRPAITQQKK